MVFDRDPPDGIADHVEGKVFEPAESHATLAHVEGPARPRPGPAEALFFAGVDIEEHQVEGEVVFLGGEGGERHGLAWVAVVAGWIDAVRHEIADHAVLHAFRETRVEAAADDGPHRLDRFRRSGGRLAR